jgi:hypothetical protein
MKLINSPVTQGATDVKVPLQPISTTVYSTPSIPSAPAQPKAEADQLVAGESGFLQQNGALGT